MGMTSFEMPRKVTEGKAQMRARGELDLLVPRRVTAAFGAFSWTSCLEKPALSPSVLEIDSPGDRLPLDTTPPVPINRTLPGSTKIQQGRSLQQSRAPSLSGGHVNTLRPIAAIALLSLFTVSAAIGAPSDGPT